MVSPKLIDLNPDKFHYYPCIIRINWCNGSCNTADDPVGKICVPNRTKHSQNMSHVKPKTKRQKDKTQDKNLRQK